MNVILVTVDNFELDYVDRYRIYSDTEEGRKNALEWAKQNGFESLWPIGFKKGMLHHYSCGNTKVGIMLTEIQEKHTCKGCGKCCYMSTPYLDVEIKFGDTVPDIYTEKRIGGPDKLETSWMKRREDGSCIALNRETNLCTIYENRPYECRDFQYNDPVCKQLLQQVQTVKRTNFDSGPLGQTNIDDDENSKCYGCDHCARSLPCPYIEDERYNWEKDE